MSSFVYLFVNEHFFLVLVVVCQAAINRTFVSIFFSGVCFNYSVLNTSEFAVIGLVLMHISEKKSRKMGLYRQCILSANFQKSSLYALGVIMPISTMYCRIPQFVVTIDLRL